MISASPRFGAMLSPGIKTALIFIFFLTLTVAILWQRLSNPALAIDDTDYFGNVWVLCWVAHALVSNPADIFNANIFYPAKFPLVFNEYGPALQLFFAPLFWISGEPNFAFNGMIALGLGLSATTATWVVWRWTRSLPAGIVAGACFAYSPINYIDFGRPFYMATWWWPLVIFWLVQALNSNSWKHWIRYVVFLTLTALSALHLLLTGVLNIALVFAYQVIHNRTSSNTGLAYWVRRLLACAIFSLLAMILAAPFYYPMVLLRLSGQVGSRLSISELVVSALPLGQFPMVSAPWQFILAAGCLLILRGKRRLHLKRLSLLCFAGLLLGYMVSLGPFLSIGHRHTFIPLPYLILTVLPGFDMLRTPTRFLSLANFWWAVLCGVGFLLISHGVIARFSKLNKRWTIASVSTLLAVLIAFSSAKFLPATTTASTASSPGAVYKWIKRNTPTDAVICEYPISEFTNSRYVYSSIFHWRRLVNGYSSYNPPSYYPFAYNTLQNIPDKSALKTLAAMGTTHLIIHEKYMPQLAVTCLKELPGPDILRFDDDLIIKLSALTPALQAAALNIALVDDATVYLPANQSVRVALPVTCTGLWRDANPNFKKRLDLQWTNLNGNDSQYLPADILLPPTVFSGQPQVAMVQMRIPDKGNYRVAGNTIDLKLNAKVRTESRKTNQSDIAASIKLLDAPTAAHPLCPLKFNALISNQGTNQFPDKVSSSFNLQPILQIGKKKLNLRELLNDIIIRKGVVVLNLVFEQITEDKAQPAKQPAKQPAATASAGADTFKTTVNQQMPPIPAGGQLEIPIYVHAPEQPGHYRAVISLTYQAQRKTADSGQTEASEQLLYHLVTPVTVEQ